MMPTSKKRAAKNTANCYQFKITLVDSHPPIWRRILVPDTTLDDLHEYIQTAMGWTNSHLHQFEIRRKVYGDPMLLEDGFGDIEFIDSLKTTLGDLFGGPRPPHRFTYEYDFGDGWRHEIEFEGVNEPPQVEKAPCCLGGSRCCPPEDIGGIWGYEEFLSAIRNPEHEEHESYMEWAGEFDPDAFSAAEATKAMRAGLPTWHEHC
jgi:hypothetical protein